MNIRFERVSAAENEVIDYIGGRNMNRIVQNIVCTVIIFMLMASILVLAQGAEISPNEYGLLFDKVENMEQIERETFSKELSDLFHAYPFEFIEELHLESIELQDTVGKMLAEYNTAEEGNTDYLQFLLSLYPEVGEQLESSEINTFLTILLAFSPDVRNAGDDFTETLFTAMRYADGVGSDQCGTILFQLFQNSPRETLSQLALEDEAFRKMAILQLVYSSWGNEAEFMDNLENLSNDETLTPTEQDLLSALAAKMAEVDETVPPETTEVTSPTVYTGATELAAPSTSIQDDPVPAGGIITAVVVLTAAIAVAAVCFGKKKHG